MKFFTSKMEKNARKCLCSLIASCMLFGTTTASIYAETQSATQLSYSVAQQIVHDFNSIKDDTIVEDVKSQLMSANDLLGEDLSTVRFAVHDVTYTYTGETVPTTMIEPGPLNWAEGVDDTYLLITDSSITEEVWNDANAIMNNLDKVYTVWIDANGCAVTDDSKPLLVPSKPGTYDIRVVYPDKYTGYIDEESVLTSKLTIKSAGIDMEVELDNDSLVFNEEDPETVDSIKAGNTTISVQLTPKDTEHFSTSDVIGKISLYEAYTSGSEPSNNKYKLVSTKTASATSGNDLSNVSFNYHVKAIEDSTMYLKFVYTYVPASTDGDVVFAETTDSFGIPVSIPAGYVPTDEDEPDTETESSTESTTEGSTESTTNSSDSSTESTTNNSDNSTESTTNNSDSNTEGTTKKVVIKPDNTTESTTSSSGSGDQSTESTTSSSGSDDKSTESTTSNSTTPGGSGEQSSESTTSSSSSGEQSSESTTSSSGSDDQSTESTTSSSGSGEQSSESTTDSSGSDEQSSESTTSSSGSDDQSSESTTNSGEQSSESTTNSTTPGGSDDPSESTTNSGDNTSDGTTDSSSEQTTNDSDSTNTTEQANPSDDSTETTTADTSGNTGDNITSGGGIDIIDPAESTTSDNSSEGTTSGSSDSTGGESTTGSQDSTGDDVTESTTGSQSSTGDQSGSNDSTGSNQQSSDRGDAGSSSSDRGSASSNYSNGKSSGGGGSSSAKASTFGICSASAGGKLTAGTGNEFYYVGSSKSKVPTPVPDAGYEFNGWQVNGKDKLNSIADQKFNKGDKVVATFKKSSDFKDYMKSYEHEFYNEGSLTRGELVGSLALALCDGNIPKAKSAKFSDVSSNEWYADAVNYFTSNGVINGYPDGTFRPGKTITKGELAVIIVKILGLQTDSNYQGVYWSSMYAAAVNNSGIYRIDASSEDALTTSVSKDDYMTVLRAIESRIPKTTTENADVATEETTEVSTESTTEDTTVEETETTTAKTGKSKKSSSSKASKESTTEATTSKKKETTTKESTTETTTEKATKTVTKETTETTTKSDTNDSEYADLVNSLLGL